MNHKTKKLNKMAMVLYECIVTRNGLSSVSCDYEGFKVSSFLIILFKTEGNDLIHFLAFLLKNHRPKKKSWKK